MKNILIITACLIAIGAGIFVVDSHHQKELNRENAAAAAVVASRKAQEDKLNGELITARSDRDYYQSQCRVGLDAYNLLTPAQKKLKPAPDCDRSFQ